MAWFKLSRKLKGAKENLDQSDIYYNITCTPDYFLQVHRFFFLLVTLK
jgi:hypothetical protein